MERGELCIDTERQIAVQSEVIFDSGGDSATRLVAVRVTPTVPQRLAFHLEAEGVSRDGDIWMAPLERFEAALSRWPTEFKEYGTNLSASLGVRWRPLCEDGSASGSFKSKRTQVMGVLNVTPDSFYDGGRYTDIERALARAHAMIQAGADMIDVGGESTRPNAQPVPAEEEMRRVIPVIRALTREVSVPVSIDTYKSVVAAAALEAGASIVNDISGLHHDPEMARVAADHGASLVIMHMKGTPLTMQIQPSYVDVVKEVKEYLARACEKALAAGVDEKKIWIDPGIGFGKNLTHNLELLARLRSFRSLGFPILVGTSNKSLIGQVLGVDVSERIEGTAATVAISIAHGADAVRVHDVAVMRRVVDMSDALMHRWKEAPDD